MALNKERVAIDKKRVAIDKKVVAINKKRVATDKSSGERVAIVREDRIVALVSEPDPSANGPVPRLSFYSAQVIEEPFHYAI